MSFIPPNGPNPNMIPGYNPMMPPPFPQYQMNQFGMAQINTYQIQKVRFTCTHAVQMLDDNRNMILKSLEYLNSENMEDSAT